MDLNKFCIDWKEIGGKKYIVRNMFACLGVNEDRYGLVPCAYGGPFLRKRNKPHSYFDILTNSGNKVVSRDIKCDPGSFESIWCHGGKIGLLYYPGIVKVYRITGELLGTYNDISKNEIILTTSFYDGVACLHADGFLSVFDYSLGRFHPFFTAILESRPICMDFIRGEQNEAYVGCENQTVVVIKETESAVIRKIPFVPSKIKISSTGTYIAIWNPQNLYIFSISSPEESLFSLSDPIDSLAFFDEGRVLAIINNKTFVYGIPSIDFELPFARAHLTIQDVDHSRLYTMDGMYFIQPIPYAISSLAKNKRLQKLFTMRDLFEKEDPQFINLLREVEPDAERYMQTLLYAALSIIDPTLQETIMSVAIFLIHIFGLNKSEYVSTIKKLRMLNTIRSPEFGFTTTSAGLDMMKPVHTIEFAMEMNYYEFAYRACNLFDFNPSLVAINWASTMFYLHGDKALSQVIGKIETIQNPDYAALVEHAKKAHMTSKSQEILIDRVRNPYQKVTFLMRIIDAKPLDYALHSLDGDAIIRTMYFTKLQMTPQDFADLLARDLIVLNHYIAYKQYIEPKIIINVQNISPTTCLRVLMVNELPPEKFGRIPEQLFALSRLIDKKSIWAKAIRRQAKSMAAHDNKMIEVDNMESPREQVAKLLRDGNVEGAQYIAKLYHVTPRMYAYIQLRTFADIGNWQSIENMASIKQPLTYEEFANFCVENGNKVVAFIFIKKIKDLEKQVALCKQLGMIAEASLVEMELMKSGKKGRK